MQLERSGFIRISELCKLRRRNRHKFAFVQDDSLPSANELPPLSRGAEHDRRYEHEKEDRNERVKAPDTCLPYQFSCLSWVGQWSTPDPGVIARRSKSQVSDRTKKL